jgi:hypothetical protein
MLRCMRRLLEVDGRSQWRVYVHGSLSGYDARRSDRVGLDWTGLSFDDKIMIYPHFLCTVVSVSNTLTIFSSFEVVFLAEFVS